MGIPFWALIVAFIGGCLVPFVLHWMKNREQIVIDLSVKTKYHPDCINAFHKNGVPRLEAERHDHMLRVSLSIANKGIRPIRIRDITATGISDKTIPSLWRHEDMKHPENKVYTLGEGPSLLNELRKRLPEKPITSEDTPWRHRWRLTYTGCEKRPPEISVTVETDRKTHYKTIQTDHCSHDTKPKIHKSAS